MSSNPFNWDGLEADYQQMVRAFEHINKLSPKSRQMFVLSRVSKFFETPRSVFRKTFEQWQLESGGQQ